MVSQMLRLSELVHPSKMFGRSWPSHLSQKSVGSASRHLLGTLKSGHVSQISVGSGAGRLSYVLGAYQGRWWCRQHCQIRETVAGRPATALRQHHTPATSRRTCVGCKRTIAISFTPLLCSCCDLAYHRSCSGLTRDAATAALHGGNWICSCSPEQGEHRCTVQNRSFRTSMSHE